MKTIHDEITLQELIARINTLNKNSKPEWGKMNVYQMAKHCAKWEEMVLRKIEVKRNLPGYIFGKIALKSMLKDGPMKRNMPSLKGFAITGNGDLEAEKKKWISLLEEHARCSNAYYPHGFFGNMTRDQTGRLDYKHIDHHLTQFGA
jgi:hypothetical protein